MKPAIHIVDVDRLETWSKYKPGMCDTCGANCCTMPLEVQLSDLVRLGLVDPFEVDNVDHTPGKPVKAELDNHWGNVSYEVDVLKADNTVMSIKIDAVNGKVLRAKPD